MDLLIMNGKSSMGNIPTTTGKWPGNLVETELPSRMLLSGDGQLEDGPITGLLANITADFPAHQ